MINCGVQHCPKIGASLAELGRKSASELRQYWNNYFNNQLEDEEHNVKFRDVEAYDDEGVPLPRVGMIKEPEACYRVSQPLNPLFSIIDEANKRTYSGKLPETPKAEPVKITPLFDILDARKKASKMARARKKK